MAKTNACRILDGLGIKYELREYAVDPDDLAAESVAAKIGFPPEQVFKTLCVRGDRKTEMVALKEVQPLTGYIRGGVTALGAKKDYPVIADETIVLWDVISISAGQRGLQIILAPDDYVRATAATLAEISHEKTPGVR